MRLLWTRRGVVDPLLAQAQLEIFKNLFRSVAEEMGIVAQRSAYSPNIKERLDFSCALFNPRGEIVAQAAHIPVHLGSMPMSVKAATEAFRPRRGRRRPPQRPLSGRHAPA